MSNTAVFVARMEPGGIEFPAPGDLPILVAAEQAGLRPASSCRNGTCRACLCHLRSGTITYRIAWPGLSAEEKADNFFLPCAAYPLSDLVMAPAGI